MCTLVMLQISHLVGMDAGKAVCERARQREGGGLEVQQELLCVSRVGQSGLCSLSDKQIPSFLMAQVGLSVPELAESVTGQTGTDCFMAQGPLSGPCYLVWGA